MENKDILFSLCPAKSVVLSGKLKPKVQLCNP